MSDSLDRISVTKRELLVFETAEDTYSAEAAVCPGVFTVTGERTGKRMEVLASALTGAAEPDTGLAYPHLSVAERAVSPEPAPGVRYEMFQVLDRTQYTTLEPLLLGETEMSSRQRLALSLSLAAAFAELERYLDGASLARFRLDAILVESARVRLDLIRLLEPGPADTAEYRRLRAHGLLPPECYEDPAREPVDPAALRHILAVLIFRCLTAADPFDGMRTLRQYPYRTEEALRHIYGREASFICAPGGDNGFGRYMGRNAGQLSRICQGLKQIFLPALCDGVTAPEKRPTAAQWLENQKHMVDWWMSAGGEWRIPDLRTGEGAPPSIRYLRLDGSGTVLPLTDGRVVYQYMLDSEDAPLDDRPVGTVRMEEGAAELRFFDEARQPVLLQNPLPQGMAGTVLERPWEAHEKKEAET